MKKHSEMVMEELVPKKEGRERMIEKRKEKGSYARQTKDDGVVSWSGFVLDCYVCRSFLKYLLRVSAHARRPT